MEDRLDLDAAVSLRSQCPRLYDLYHSGYILEA